MEYGLAQVTLVGELLRDPEFFYTQYGTAMCRCTLLATRKVASPDAESKEVTTWFNCVTFGKAAEALNQAAKGARLFMQGDLNMRPYARQDGSDGYDLEVVVEKVVLLDRREPGTDVDLLDLETEEDGDFDEEKSSSGDE